MMRFATYLCHTILLKMTLLNLVTLDAQGLQVFQFEEYDQHQRYEPRLNYYNTNLYLVYRSLCKNVKIVILIAASRTDISSK